MAAKLKFKRALAEFSQITQEEPKPVKRLRLIQKPSQPEIRLNVPSGSSLQEILCALVTLEQHFPVDHATADCLFPELMELYNSSRDTLVRGKVLGILARLATVPEFNPQVISDQLLPKLKSEESQKVLSLLVAALTSVGCCIPNSLVFHQQLVSSCQKLLGKASHIVRARCLELIGELGSCGDDKTKESPSSSSADSLLHLLGQYTSDDDPRVRAEAFTAMLRLYERGQLLNQSVYAYACSGLNDDNEDVRRKATKLVWVLCRLYPESIVNCGNEGEETLRLVDDGFAKICNLMTDISLNVRVEAAALLGSLHQVSGRFLEQTLDKKLMSNMRRKLSAHDRAKEQYECGEWATGAKWADDKPRDNLEAESISLMNIGACGAFIHGLEDEFLEVRNAALDSLCELAVQSPRFAVLSQDSIIDMVNDEIESVRLNAINSLRKLSRHLLLRDDQLEIVLGVLQDFSYVSREALRGLLGEVSMATRESVKATLLALLDNLKRYPEDRTSIWICAQKIGARNAQLTMMLAEELLNLHPYIVSTEEDTEDPSYVTRLLAVFNAAAKCPTMVALFPEHIHRHYTFLRSSLSHMVPKIHALETSDTQAGEKVVGRAAISTGDFLQQLLDKLNGLSTLDLDSTEQLLRICVRDLERVEALDKNMSASAECTCLFLTSQFILTELMKSTTRTDTEKVYQENVAASVDKILQSTTRLQTLFLGLGGELTAMVRQTEVKALAVQLLFRLERATLGEKVRASNTFKNYLSLIKNYVDSDPDSYDSFTQQVVKLCDSLDWSRLQVLPEIFRDLIKHLKPSVTLVAPCDVRKTTAVIDEPPPSSDMPLKFPAGLAARVMLVATVYNLEDTNRLSVLVRYPDQHTQYIIPPAMAWTRMGPLKHRLVVPVMLSHGLWSEACYVEIGLVVEACGEGRQLLKLQDSVPLTEPVKVLVSPNKLKR